MSQLSIVQNLNNLKNLPYSWEVKDFKDVVADNSGGNKKLAKSNFLKEGNIAIVDQGKGLIAGYYNELDLAVKTSPPYVIFGDHTRAFKYIDFSFVMGADGTKVLQPKSKKCDTKFLYYFFLSINVPNTGYNRHFKYLKNLKIPLPPLNQQKKIAVILDAADAYRQKTKVLIAKYEKLNQSLFIDMFGDPLSNDNRFKIVKLGDITSKITDGVHAKPDYTEEGVSFISVKDVTTGVLKFDKCKFISEEAHKKYYKRCNPELGDIIYTKVGATYGRAVIVDVDFQFSLYVSVALLKPLRELINPVYLKEAMVNPAIKRQADRSIKGIGVPDLHLNMIKKFILPLPPLNLQDKFAELVYEIEKQKTQAQNSLKKSEDLFNCLLQKAFKGEL